MRSKPVFTLSIVGSLLVAACGGSDDGAATGNTAPSGGSAGKASGGAAGASAGSGGNAAGAAGKAGSPSAGQAGASGTGGATAGAGGATAGAGGSTSGAGGSNAGAGGTTAGAGGSISGAGGSTAGAGGATAGAGGSIAGAGGSTAGAGGAVAGAGGSAAGTGGAAGGSAGVGGAGGSAGGCSPGCSFGFDCCNGKCVNKDNDINNCGTCGNACLGGNPFCAQGTCGTPPCEGTVCIGTKFCCGATCCDIGDLCCDVPGPVSQGPKCQKPNAEGTCDTGCKGCVCDSPDTPIATATGERPIASLSVGDLVYSMHDGKIALVPIRVVHRVSAPHHVVVRVELQSGAVLHISGPHPTADGRTFAALRAGDLLDGVRVVSTKVVPFAHDATYDILPESDSGTYFAGGVLIGSTLWRGEGRAESPGPTAPQSR